MTNMKKFAAQQLTKKQMNEVKGGMSCIVTSGGATYRVTVEATNIAGAYVEAAAKVSRETGEHAITQGCR